MVRTSFDLLEPRTWLVTAAGSALLTACIFSSPGPLAPPMGAVTGTLRFLEGSASDTEIGPVVVILEPLERTPERSRPTQLFQIRSSTDRFDPAFTAIAEGDYVVFANGGSVSHRFFSAHLGPDIQIPVSPAGSSDPVRIDRRGEVRFFCSLHPDESFGILVTSEVFSGVVRSDGSYYVGPLPDGTYRLSIWSPELEGPIRTVELDGGRSIVEPIVLDPNLIGS